MKGGLGRTIQRSTLADSAATDVVVLAARSGEGPPRPLSYPLRSLACVDEQLEPHRISGRLKNALVADLVMKDPTSTDGDYWLAKPLRDEQEWTEHLGRQLGMSGTYGPGDIHSTLMVIVRELNEVVSRWPLPHEDQQACRALASAATKFLSPLEVYATLLVGPASWRNGHIEGCRVERLHSHMQPLLEKGITAELTRMLRQWTDWNIRDLADRRREAINAAETEKARLWQTGPRVPHQRQPGGDPDKRRDGYFQPPGRA